MRQQIQRVADNVRSRFESALLRRKGAIGVVIELAIFNLLVVGSMSWFQKRLCGEPEVRIIDLELTFSAHRFDALLNLLKPRTCRPFFEWTFVSFDLLFPIGYGLGLCALFLWAERQRRFTPKGKPIEAPLPFRNHVFVLVPLLAGLIDIILENGSLLAAAVLLHFRSADSLLVAAWVCIGSVGAAMKWTLVFLSILTIIAEVLSCSRGRVLRRLRFSVIAVVLGSVPLLLIPQGQDILLRVVEGDRPWVRIVAALAALLFAARTVWYCGRKLVQLVFPGDPDPQDKWYLFFAEHNPRQLGIAILALGGAAFARAGGALDLFVIAAGGGFVATHYATQKWSGLSTWISRPFMRGYRKKVPDFDAQITRTIIASVVGVVVILTPWKYRSIPPDFFLLRTTAWLLLVLAWAFFLYVYPRRERIIHRNAQALDPDKEVRLKRADGSETDPFRPQTAELLHIEPEAVAAKDQNRLLQTIKRDLKLGVGACFLAVIVFTFWPVESARSLGSLVILVIVTSGVVFLGSIASWVFGRYRIPVVPVLVLFAVLFSVWNDSHVIRTLKTGAVQIAGRPDIGKQLTYWRGHDTSSVPTPIFLVAAAGGGLRAAYWTATSLAAIQSTNHAFNTHLFAISGVSGGSLGAAVYAAIVRDVERSGGSLTCRVTKVTNDTSTFGPYHDCVRSFMAEDFLSPLLARMIGPDFVQLMLPVPVKLFDRSVALEQSWERSYFAMTKRRTMSEAFLALAPDTTASGRSVPALFLNTTHVQTGKRYVTTPLVRGDSTPPRGSRARTMHAAGDLLDILQSDMRLSTAVHNSARFTYASPPGRIHRNDSAYYGHVVDGGYFENSGLATLREILDVVRSNRSTPGLRPLVPVVIYLCNDPVGCRDSGAGDTIITTKQAAVNEWAGPIRALLGTRDARGSLARADVEDIDDINFIQLNVCETLIAENFASKDTSALLGSNERRQRAKERIVKPPLGWLLSKAARDWMDASLTPGDSIASSACRKNNVSEMKKVDSLLRLTR